MTPIVFGTFHEVFACFVYIAKWFRIPKILMHLFRDLETLFSHALKLGNKNESIEKNHKFMMHIITNDAYLCTGPYGRQCKLE